MRRLFSAVIISIVSVSVILGASPAFAQIEDNEKTVSVSSQGSSDNQTTPQIFAVNNELMKELDSLVRTFQEANEPEVVRELQEKIQVIKEEIRKASEKPMVMVAPAPTQVVIEKPRAISGEEEPSSSLVIIGPPVVLGEVGPTQVVVEKPTAVGSSQETGVSSAPVDWCAEVQALEEKKKHYEGLYALSDEELKDKGYRGGKEDIKNTVANLEASIERARIKCEGGVSSKSGGGSAPISPTETSPVEFVIPRPIAVASGGEITDYYKRRIAEIATEEVAIEKQIASLEGLRDEIDKLIEELIKSKAEISAEEVSGIVTRIEVRPGEVRMDKVVVKTVDKSVLARIDNKELAIKPAEARVIIHDADLEINALELSIENEVLRVGDSEVNLRPTAVIEKINIEPKEIELKEENAKAVYKVKADENRKLFGFIPVKVETTLTVDAASTEANIIKEEKPWWAFFTTK